MSIEATAARPASTDWGNVLAFLTLGVVLLSALPLGGNRPVSWTLFSGAVFVLFALQIFTSWRRPRGQAVLIPAALCLTGTLAWILVQLAMELPAPWAHPDWARVDRVAAPISADPIQSAHNLIRMAAYAMIFWIMASLSMDPKTAMRLMMTVAVALALLAAFGLMFWLLGWNPILKERSPPLVTASFPNRNHFATYMIFGLLANLGAYLHMAEGSRGRRRHALRDAIEGFFNGAWVFAVGVLLCLSALLLSQSRGGALAAVVGVLSFLALYGRKSGSRMGLVALATLMAFSSVSLASGTLSRLWVTTAEEGRLMIFPAVLEGIQDRFWIGHGAGAFHDSFRIYKPAELAASEVVYAHSTYLQAAFELGVPASVALFAGCSLIVIALTWRGLRRKRYRTLPIVAASAAASAAVHALVDFSLQIPAVAALFAALLGIGWAQAFRPRSGRSRSATIAPAAPDVLAN